MAKSYIVRGKELDAQGRCRVVFNGTTFAIPNLLPGEKAEIALVYGKHETTARLVKLLEPSKERIEPACPNFVKCGGCQLMHLPYERQLALKEQRVRELLAPLAGGGTSRTEFYPILGMSGAPFSYRNKVHATFGGGVRTPLTCGLYEEFSHRIVPVSACAIEHPKAAGIKKSVLDFARKYRLPAYDEDRGRGLLRHLWMRFNEKGEVLVVLVIGQPQFREKQRLVAYLCERHPEIVGIVLNINTAKTTMVLGTQEEILYGNGTIGMCLGEHSFALSPKSFFQINQQQTERLYAKAVEFAGVQPGERVVDAYCGIGTITMALAKAAPDAYITGVELNPDAVADARHSATACHARHLSFVQQDAGAYLLQLAQKRETLDVLVMDPPRSGSSKDFLRAALTLQPKRIVYISCNPETLARDCRELSKTYRLQIVQPVDMFPQTGHVETVCLLSRKAPV